MKITIELSHKAIAYFEGQRLEVERVVGGYPNLQSYIEFIVNQQGESGYREIQFGEGGEHDIPE